MADELYNGIIIEAARGKAGAGQLEEPRTRITCDNPLCGDRVTLDIRTANGAVEALAHKTRGCLLTQAAACVLAAHAPGMSREELARLEGELEALLAGQTDETSLPELSMFTPVAAIKSRHECVLLPFRALSQALRQADEAG
ncbi:iron-sulfur cluster assembly scaffold protein [Geminicoccaceae bacterium 1502E]|nr:iron-sulfur cluster assembly scaffold protein [Geminicoccaceae bacterium 1502E]